MVRTLLATLTVGLSLTFAAGLVAADDNACKIAVKGENAVVTACKQGGIKRAKATMKAMQKVANSKGKKWDCNDCHKDESAGNWDLTKDGEKLFKEMLELTKDAK